MRVCSFSDRSPKAEPPVFLKKIGDVEVYDGMKAKFTACAAGWPQPEVEWFLNGDRIYPNEHTQIDVEPNGRFKTKDEDENHLN